MRDPREVVRQQVEGRINGKVWGAKAKVEGAGQMGLNKVTGAADRALDSVDPSAKKKKKKKKRMGWWPFGGDGDEVDTAGCGSCGREVDPGWEVCPYCGNGLTGAGPVPIPGAGAMPAPGMGAMPQVSEGTNRTVAIDIAALKGPSKSVVGWLVALNGPQKGLDFRIYEGANTLGAAADNDIVITDEYLSSRHANIRYEDGRYDYIDADSTNGSYINEKRVSKEELIDNDTVRLGRTEFRFKALY